MTDPTSSPSLPSSDDYYALLNLSRTSTPDDIRQSYRLLSCFHPDKLHSSSLPPNLPPLPLSLPFLRINRAFAILSDPLTRWAYDIYGERGVRAVHQLAISPHLHTQHAVRERLRRALDKGKDGGKEAEEDEEEEEADDVEDDDWADVGQRQPRVARRVGKGWESLQTESSPTRVVWVLRAFRLFGYGARGWLPDVKERVGLALDQPPSYHTFHYSHLHPALRSFSSAPSSLGLLPLTAASTSLQHSTSVRLSPSVLFTAEVAAERRGDRVAAAVTTGLQRRWAAVSLAAQVRDGLGARGRTATVNAGWQVSPHSRLQLDGAWDVRRISMGRGALPAGSTLSFQHSLPSSTHTSVSVSIAGATVAAVEWSVASALTPDRAVEQELTVQADKERLSLEERLSVHIGRRRALKVYLKLTLSIPHSLAQPSALALPSSLPSLSSLSTASLAPFGPALTVGGHYQPSTRHTLGAWFTVATKGCSITLSYRFSSFALTLPIQLTPEPAVAPALVALTTVPLALVLSRRLYLALHREAKRGRLQRELNEEGLRLLAEREAVKAWAKEQRGAARARRKEQRRTRGLVILYARWVWEGETDPSLPSVVDVTAALQLRVEGVGADAALTVDPAASLLPPPADPAHTLATLPEGGLFVRWELQGKERIREWKASDAVSILSASDDDPATLRAEAASTRKERQAYQSLRDSQSSVIDEDDAFW